MNAQQVGEFCLRFLEDAEERGDTDFAHVVLIAAADDRDADGYSLTWKACGERPTHTYRTRGLLEDALDMVRSLQ